MKRREQTISQLIPLKPLDIATFGIDTSRIIMASSIVNEAFIDISASLRSGAFSGVAVVAPALPRSRGVGACGVGMASAVIGQALVDVNAASFADTVSLVARVAYAIT